MYQDNITLYIESLMYHNSNFLTSNGSDLIVLLNDRLSDFSKLFFIRSGGQFMVTIKYDNDNFAT